MRKSTHHVLVMYSKIVKDRKIKKIKIKKNVYARKL